MKPIFAVAIVVALSGPARAEGPQCKALHWQIEHLPLLVHVPNGQRAAVAQRVAAWISSAKTAVKSGDEATCEAALYHP